MHVYFNNGYKYIPSLSLNMIKIFLNEPDNNNKYILSLSFSMISNIFANEHNINDINILYY